MNCQLQVYKGGYDVCQLRLDFLHFDLGPPDPYSGQCNKDAFLVTGSAYSPPVICGKNTGQHSKLQSLYFAVIFLKRLKTNFCILINLKCTLILVDTIMDPLH